MRVSLHKKLNKIVFQNVKNLIIFAATLAGVLELVDKLDLGSSASAYGFESLHPHKKSLTGFSVRLFLIYLLILMRRGVDLLP